MSDAPSRILFASENLRATLKPAGGVSRPLVITFAALDDDLSLDRAGFGDPWVGGAGYDAVHVVSTRNSWYQFPEMPALFAALREHAASYPRAVAFGSSMGGYAAIRFAGRVGAETAIAISPQFSIDPVRAPFDSRWAERARDLEFLWEDPDPRDKLLTRAWVIYDPRDTDRLHVDALAKTYPVHPLPVRYASHPAGAYLAEAGLLSGAVADMIDEVFDPATFLSEAWASRRKTAQYFQSLAERARERRPRLALSLIERAVARSPQGVAYVVANALLSCGVGEPAETENLLRKALALAPGHPLLQLRLAENLHDQGRPREAAKWAAAIRGVMSAGVQLALCDLFFRLGDDHAALAAAKAAQRLQPRSRKILARRLALSILLTVPALGGPLLGLARRHARRAPSSVA